VGLRWIYLLHVISFNDLDSLEQAKWSHEGIPTSSTASKCDRYSLDGWYDHSSWLRWFAFQHRDPWYHVHGVTLDLHRGICTLLFFGLFESPGLFANLQYSKRKWRCVRQAFWLFSCFLANYFGERIDPSYLECSLPTEVAAAASWKWRSLLRRVCWNIRLLSGRTLWILRPCSFHFQSDTLFGGNTPSVSVPFLGLRIQRNAVAAVIAFSILWSLGRWGAGALLHRWKLNCTIYDDEHYNFC